MMNHRLMMLALTMCFLTLNGADVIDTQEVTQKTDNVYFTFKLEKDLLDESFDQEAWNSMLNKLELLINKYADYPLETVINQKSNLTVKCIFVRECLDLIKSWIRKITKESCMGGQLEISFQDDQGNDIYTYLVTKD